MNTNTKTAALEIQKQADAYRRNEGWYKINGCLILEASENGSDVCITAYDTIWGYKNYSLTYRGVNDYGDEHLVGFVLSEAQIEELVAEYATDVEWEMLIESGEWVADSDIFDVSFTGNYGSYDLGTVELKYIGEVAAEIIFKYAFNYLNEKSA